MKKSFLVLSAIAVLVVCSFISCEDVTEDMDQMTYENFEENSATETAAKPRARTKATLMKSKL